jgi:hypothetical protein
VRQTRRVHKNASGCGRFDTDGNFHCSAGAHATIGNLVAFRVAPKPGHFLILTTPANAPASSWPGIAVFRTASLPLACDPAIHVLARSALLPPPLRGGSTAEGGRGGGSGSKMYKAHLDDCVVATCRAICLPNRRSATPAKSSRRPARANQAPDSAPVPPAARRACAAGERNGRPCLGRPLRLAAEAPQRVSGGENTPPGETVYLSARTVAMVSV